MARAPSGALGVFGPVVCIANGVTMPERARRPIAVAPNLPVNSPMQQVPEIGPVAANAPTREDAARRDETPASHPPSATSTAVAAAGCIALLAAIALVVFLRPFAHDVVPSAILVIALTAVAIFAADLGWQRVYRRPSTGLDFALDDPSWSRTLVKYVGLLASVGLVAAAYWLLPEYRNRRYDDYWTALYIVIGPWLILAVPYFFAVDRKMREPRDGYWQMGALVLLRLRDVDRRKLAQHLLGWAIKAYFMAIMWGFLCGDLSWAFLYDFEKLDNFQATYDFLWRLLYMVDVGLASLGYVMSFRITDTHIRSSESTMVGWIVTLACYEPFWSAAVYPFLRYDTGYPWGAWLSYRPVLYVLWGSGILVLTAIYAWATVMFGARFSNLTNRGVITSGPYRYTKHPAYLAKNITWWMISVPFLPLNNAWDTLPRCAMLLGVNLIYFMRAKTEEWHLSRDPDYVRYALWMEAHGLLRFMRRLPLLGRIGFRRPERASA